eukprot:gene13882-biopygen1470
MSPHLAIAKAHRVRAVALEIANDYESTFNSTMSYLEVLMTQVASESIRILQAFRGADEGGRGEPNKCSPGWGPSDPAASPSPSKRRDGCGGEFEQGAPDLRRLLRVQGVFAWCCFSAGAESALHAAAPALAPHHPAAPAALGPASGGCSPRCITAAGRCGEERDDVRTRREACANYYFPHYLFFSASTRDWHPRDWHSPQNA